MNINRVGQASFKYVQEPTKNIGGVNKMELRKTLVEPTFTMNAAINGVFLKPLSLFSLLSS